jgi:outer membrane protein, heavy metal efflux system
MQWFSVRTLALACALWVGVASAQSGAEPLTLSAAMKRALDQNPELQGFAFELRAQEARIGEAGLRPVTSAEALLEDAGGTGDRRGLDAAQTTLSLSHIFELGGKREGRVAVAEAARSRMQTELAARQLDVVAEVARRFIETLHEREGLRIAEEGTRLAERTREAASRRAQAALAPAAEIARAEVRVSQAMLELEHAEHELESSRVFLAAAMGERTVRFGDAVGDLFATNAITPLDELLERVEQSPELVRFADEARLRDAELRLAELKRRPDIRGQLGVRRYEQGDDVALMAGVSVPLQSARRATYGIDIARADRARTDAEREAALLRVQAQLRAQYREIEHLQLESRTLRETIVPQLQNALERTELAFQRGRYSYLELTDAQRELLNARGRLSDVAANIHILRVEIERLTGQSIETIGVTP